MARNPAPLAHCYRCIYSWRPRRPSPRLCPRCKSRLWDAPKIRPAPPRPTGLGVEQVIGPHRAAIRRLTRRYEMRSLRVFGSVARGEAGSRSDVDLLYDPARPITLLERIRLRMALERILRRTVDLCREEELKWSIRPQAVADAVEL